MRLFAPAVFALAGTVAAGAEPDWRLVETYLELDEAWHAQERKISNARFAAAQIQRLRKELGEHPDIVPAVAAARAIIESDGKRAIEAAEFLMEHPRGLSPTADSDIEFGTATLADRVEPDWSEVERYQNRRKGLLSRLFSRKPSGPKAIAAARAIVGLGGTHHRTADAAAFLIEHGGTMRGGSIHNVRIGIRTLSGIPNYGDWPRIIMYMDRLRSEAEEIDEFLQGMADDGKEPVVRATARYYAASRLARSIDTASDKERKAYRERALTLATGLSVGIEDVGFVGTLDEDESATPTLADAERAILDMIRYSTVGGTASELGGRRLDGIEESLAAYGEQVVLVDFWATWCGPCIASLPRLRDLAAELPEDRFEILSISIDAELESVTEFLADESMPWAHWHVGVGSELARIWQVRAIPTYVLIDVNGTILGKGNRLSDDFLARLRDAVADSSQGDPDSRAERPGAEA